MAGSTKTDTHKGCNLKAWQAEGASATASARCPQHGNLGNYMGDTLDAALDVVKEVVDTHVDQTH